MSYISIEDKQMVFLCKWPEIVLQLTPVTVASDLCHYRLTMWIKKRACNHIIVIYVCLRTFSRSFKIHVKIIKRPIGDTLLKKSLFDLFEVITTWWETRSKILTFVFNPDNAGYRVARYWNKLQNPIAYCILFFTPVLPTSALNCTSSTCFYTRILLFYCTVLSSYIAAILKHITTLHRLVTKLEMLHIPGSLKLYDLRNRTSRRNTNKTVNS